MKFNNKTSEVFVPDNTPIDLALARTTHLAIGAHPGDIEIMSAGPILERFNDPNLWFSGVILSNGAGSPRSGTYQNYGDDKICMVRRLEQKKAAIIGHFSAHVMLDYPSNLIKDPAQNAVIEDISRILVSTKPSFVFTHNLADKHDTHVSSALRVIAAIRGLPADQRPKKLYGCEVWRDLDWMVESDKVISDLSQQEGLQLALLEVHDSQINGGKRYDLGVIGRRRAHATFAESHDVDISRGQSFEMDLTPLIEDDTIEIEEFVQKIIDHFSLDVKSRLLRYE